MFQVRDLNRSQELGIFYGGAEVKLKTSSIGFIILKYIPGTKMGKADRLSR